MPTTCIEPQKVRKPAYLIHSIRESINHTNIPRHALLLGAGCSFNCGIPLGSGIIELCQLNTFLKSETMINDLMLSGPDRLNVKILREKLGDFQLTSQYEQFISEKHSELRSHVEKFKGQYLNQIGSMIDGEPDWEEFREVIFADSLYGFWISAFSESGNMRQQFIEQIIENKMPDGAYIILAYLIAQGTFTNVLTTNFDDLINEALIYYTGKQCRFYADDELSRFISIHSTKPNIIKLHGDFRFANMSNTFDETSKLSPNRKSRFSHLLSELGLIVIGYNGADHSIMSALYEQKKANDFPLIWCGTSAEKVHWRVAHLINKTKDSYFVQIESFLQISGLVASYFLKNKTHSADNIVYEAKKRQELANKTISEFVAEFKGTDASLDEKGKLDRTLESKKFVQQADIAESFQEQIELYNKAIEADSQNCTAYNNRGYNYFSMKLYDLALNDFAKSIELSPNDAAGYSNRGAVYIVMNRLQEALSDFTKSIMLDPLDASTHSNRGCAYNKLKEYDKAIEDLDQAIALKEDFVKAYYHRGNSKFGKGEIEEAIADYTKAINLNELYSDAYEQRAKAFEAIGASDRAAQDLVRLETIHLSAATPK